MPAIRLICMRAFSQARTSETLLHLLLELNRFIQNSRPTFCKFFITLWKIRIRYSIFLIINKLELHDLQIIFNGLYGCFIPYHKIKHCGRDHIIGIVVIEFYVLPQIILCNCIQNFESCIELFQYLGVSCMVKLIDIVDRFGNYAHIG
jgi:hypothetical protein